MNTIPLFFSSYDVFSGKFQSAHFVLFRNVRLRWSYSTVQIYFVKSSGNRVPWYFNAKVSMSSFRHRGCCRKSIIFLFITNPSVSLAVVFLSLPGGFLTSHDPVFSGFLKISWVTLLDFRTVFEISPIESLSSLRNLAISFLSSNDVTDFSPCLQCKNRCNLVKFPILYS